VTTLVGSCIFNFLPHQKLSLQLLCVKDGISPWLSNQGTRYIDKKVSFDSATIQTMMV
jgi:hypothetical protein